MIPPRSYWNRCIKDAGPGVQARFKTSLELFFGAIHRQALDRDSGVIPELEDYILLRRDTSGCKPVFDLIEYALRIDLPEAVVSHPVIKALNQSTNDLVTWSNVCSISLVIPYSLNEFLRTSSPTTWNRREEIRTTW